MKEDYDDPPMKFNPGTMSYEPDLPLTNPEYLEEEQTHEKSQGARYHWDNTSQILFLVVLAVVFVITIAQYFF